MDSETKLQRWERHAEWPLAVAAILVLFSRQVLAQPQGREGHIVWAVDWAIWGLFVVNTRAHMRSCATRSGAGRATGKGEQ